jgi:hypothetical protein
MTVSRSGRSVTVPTPHHVCPVDLQRRACQRCRSWTSTAASNGWRSRRHAARAAVTTVIGAAQPGAAGWPPTVRCCRPVAGSRAAAADTQSPSTGSPPGRSSALVSCGSRRHDLTGRTECRTSAARVCCEQESPSPPRHPSTLGEGSIVRRPKDQQRPHPDAAPPPRQPDHQRSGHHGQLCRGPAAAGQQPAGDRLGSRPHEQACPVAAGHG